MGKFTATVFFSSFVINSHSRSYKHQNCHQLQTASRVRRSFNIQQIINTWSEPQCRAGLLSPSPFFMISISEQRGGDVSASASASCKKRRGLANVLTLNQRMTFQTNHHSNKKNSIKKKCAGPVFVFRIIKGKKIRSQKQLTSVPKQTSIPKHTQTEIKQNISG